MSVSGVCHVLFLFQYVIIIVIILMFRNIFEQGRGPAHDCGGVWAADIRGDRLPAGSCPYNIMITKIDYDNYNYGECEVWAADIRGDRLPAGCCPLHYNNN